MYMSHTQGRTHTHTPHAEVVYRCQYYSSTSSTSSTNIMNAKGQSCV